MLYLHQLLGTKHRRYCLTEPVAETPFALIAAVDFGEMVMLDPSAASSLLNGAIQRVLKRYASLDGGTGMGWHRGGPTERDTSLEVHRHCIAARTINEGSETSSERGTILRAAWKRRISDHWRSCFLLGTAGGNHASWRPLLHSSRTLHSASTGQPQVLVDPFQTPEQVAVTSLLAKILVNSPQLAYRRAAAERLGDIIRGHIGVKGAAYLVEMVGHVGAGWLIPQEREMSSIPA